MEENSSTDDLFNDVTAVLEKHSEILLVHSSKIEQLLKEVAAVDQKIAALNRRLQKAESTNSVRPSDSEFLANASARLKAISNAIDAKP